MSQLDQDTSSLPKAAVELADQEQQAQVEIKVDGKWPKNAFEQAGQEESLSLAREFWLFITENKKWWMIPILVVMSLVGLLVLVSSTGLLPFVYTVF